MSKRASNSGISLTETDAAMVKGMLARGDRQHDVAAWFGVNGGRIAEIATGFRFEHVHAADEDELPPPGPYASARVTHAALTALGKARAALDLAEAMIHRSAS